MGMTYDLHFFWTKTHNNIKHIKDIILYYIKELILQGKRRDKVHFRACMRIMI